MGNCNPFTSSVCNKMRRILSKQQLTNSLSLSECLRQDPKFTIFLSFLPVTSLSFAEFCVTILLAPSTSPSSTGWTIKQFHDNFVSICYLFFDKKKKENIFAEFNSMMMTPEEESWESDVILGLSFLSLVIFFACRHDWVILASPLPSSFARRDEDGEHCTNLRQVMMTQEYKVSILFLYDESSSENDCRQDCMATGFLCKFFYFIPVLFTLIAHMNDAHERRQFNWPLGRLRNVSCSLIDVLGFFSSFASPARLLIDVYR